MAGGGRPLVGPGGGWGVILGLDKAVEAEPALGPPEPACGQPLTLAPLLWLFIGCE
jgi:hypothetical protein